jgi:hypothetical protein
MEALKREGTSNLVYHAHKLFLASSVFSGSSEYRALILGRFGLEVWITRIRSQLCWLISRLIGMGRE